MQKVQEEEKKHAGPDEDFIHLSRAFDIPDDEWENLTNKEHIKIFRKKVTESTVFCFKIYAHLPGIPKEVAFKACSDFHFRKTWDEMLAKSNIVEDDIVKNEIVYQYMPPVPMIVSAREGVLRRKMLRDFPKPGNLCIH